MISAILIGNAAYEAGNITGAVLGFQVEKIAGVNPLILVVALLAFLLLFSSNAKILFFDHNSRHSASTFEKLNLFSSIIYSTISNHLNLTSLKFSSTSK